ncbi:MAG TPA: arsenate reductase (glutaredoxin) [Cytophagaceae bacterium]
MIKIFHNPRCTKSRQALELLKSKGKSPEVIEYLKTPPTVNELKDILKLLKVSPEELIRKGEALYKENYKGKSFSEDEWIKIMVENPILIERPVVIAGKKAVIGRPPEKVLEII